MTTTKVKTQAVSLQMKRENNGDKLSITDTKAMNDYVKKYMRHITVSKTERQAHDDAVALLKNEGAVSYESVIKSGKSVKAGTLIYASQQGKTLMAIRVGTRPLREGLRIVGGHTDVPHLHLKPIPLYEDSQICLMDTHYYGGVKKYQWVTMPLALHGTIVKQNGEVIKVSIGEKLDEPVFIITDLLPHLAKDQRTKPLSEGITGEGLNALCGSIPASKANVAEDDAGKLVKANVLKFLNQQYGINEEDLTSAELSLVPAGPAREVGFDRSMIAAFGHDDRVCAFAGLQAMIDAPKVDYTSVVLLCDKEEIGSVSTTGMQSYFFENVVAHLCALQYQGAYNDLITRDCLQYSAMLSADVCALHDPNYPSVSSPNNQAVINGGVVVSKYLGSGGKGGSNDASAEFCAKIRKIYNEAGVIWQTSELGKVDEGGGGTIAIYMAKYGMDVIDSGVGLFSMHAPWEVCSKLDAFMAYKAYKAFLKDNAQ